MDQTPNEGICDPRDIGSVTATAGQAPGGTAHDSLLQALAGEVGKIEGVESLYVRKDRGCLRIWTVLDDTNVLVEDKVYDAQLRLMDRLDIPCDCSIIFRQGKDPTAVQPAGALRLFP
jgi:hypothetical protein